MKFTAFCPKQGCNSHKFVTMQNNLVVCKKCQMPWYLNELKILPQLDEDEMKVMINSKIKKEAKQNDCDDGKIYE